jgi:tRNA1(Val) A37 N6-methylase TrmN6
MFPPRPTELAHRLLRDFIRSGDRVIDATAGNGHDTVFLAECVGESGKVLAFDIQAAAIDAARGKIENAGYAQQVEFHHCCHSEMETRASAGTIAVVMFNLGYLPGRDHAITTERAATLRALESAAAVIVPGGILSVVCYPGHEAGRDESSAVEIWMAGLTACGWKIASYGMLGTRNPAPFLLIGRKPD